MSGVTDEVRVDGLRIAYRRSGNGPVLVLLHGAVCDGRVWRHAIDAFSDAFTVVAWDAPGCGASSDAPDGFRMPDFADCLAAFVDALALERPHVLGHSWGSTLALELCLRHPTMVRSLVLVGAYAGWTGSLPANEVEARLAFALSAAKAIESGEWRPSSMRGLFSDVMPAEQQAELTTIMAEVRAAGTRTMAYALAEADLSSSLDRVDAPTLLVYGDDDERAPLDVARALHAGIANSQLTLLPGLGHECYLESPDAFADAVRRFLS
jgi:pimeloyl-ACP methyl ester carboxylesterase